jgi:hypothetical protein
VKTLTITELKWLREAAQRASVGDQQAKSDFHKLADSLLNDVAVIMGISADLRHNKGGVAVAGEITLHGDAIYIQLSGTPLGVLVRSVTSRKDYTGNRNTWVSWDRLMQHGANGLARHASQLIAAQEAM